MSNSSSREIDAAELRVAYEANRIALLEYKNALLAKMQNPGAYTNEQIMEMGMQVKATHAEFMKVGLVAR